MRLKSFHARTMTEAMQQVRQELGDEAIIVATREENGGKTVRITAAIDEVDTYHKDIETQNNRQKKDTDMATSPAFELDTERNPFSNARMAEEPVRDDWLQYDDENDEQAVYEELTDVMLRHAVPEDVTDQVISCAMVMGLEKPSISLMAALEHLFHYKPLEQGATDKAFMLIGPPGAGKTLAAAKIAARGVMEGLKVAVITMDCVRAGGVEQLQAFTRLLQINLKKATNSTELRAALEQCAGADQIIIDTAGASPFDAENMKNLAKMIAVGNGKIEPILVLPAGIDADESGEMARTFATIGARRIIPSRVEITRRLGGLISAAHHGGLAFADASNTPHVADGLLPLSPESLTELLMPESKRDNLANRKLSGTHQ